MLSFSPEGAVQVMDTPASPCIRGMVVFSVRKMSTMLLASPLSLPAPLPSPSAGGVPPPVRLLTTIAATMTASSTPTAIRNIRSPFFPAFFGAAGGCMEAAPTGMGRGCT